MFVRYLPLIFVLAALAMALAPLEAAGQSPVPSVSDINAAHAAQNADKPRPKTSGAPVNANAGKTPLPPGVDARAVRPAEAFPPERIQAPSRGALRTPDPGAGPAQKDDPRSVEERSDPGG